MQNSIDKLNLYQIFILLCHILILKYVSMSYVLKINKFMKVLTSTNLIYQQITSTENVEKKTYIVKYNILFYIFTYLKHSTTASFELLKNHVNYNILEIHTLTDCTTH
jgi:hypothetical protein